MKKILFFPFVLFILFSSRISFADSNIVFPMGLLQNEFQSLSKEVGLAIVDIPLSPAAPLGIIGFDAGIEASAISIHNNDLFWKKVTSTTSAPPSTLIVPKLHVQKGLPGNIDIGVVYSSVPGSNISLIGGELKFAILEGSVATPAVALRGSYTKLNGVSDLNLNVIGVDASISKGIGPLTPYAGVEEVFIQSSANNTTLNLNSENIQSFKGFVGAKFSLMIINLVGQIDIGELPVYSLRLNVGW